MDEHASPRAARPSDADLDPRGHDSRDAFIRFLAGVLRELATLSDALAADVGPVVQAAPTGPQRTAAMRGLQLQDTLKQRLERLAIAAETVTRDQRADLAATLKLDGLVERLEREEDPPRHAPAPSDVELF